VDLAAESGGNVAGSKFGEIITTENGVKFIGDTSFESDVSGSASQMFSANVYNFIEHFTDKEKGFTLNLEDPILKGCVITSGGEIPDERFR
ncbi:MAG: hypothetical protein J6P03_06225, partial [Opitutales bacterium]|nr:hypothetical protein [Opitutales bacterium]